MTTIANIRGALSDALVNDGVWSVFSFPPSSPIANSVIVSPDDPYIEPQNNQYGSISYLANFKISLIVPLFDNQGNLTMIENYYTALMTKLSAAPISIRIGAISAPSTTPSDAGEMLMSEMSVSILGSWS